MRLAAVLLAAQWAHAGQFTYKSAAVMDPRSCESESWYADSEETLGAEMTCRAEAPVSLKLEAGMPRDGAGSYAVETKFGLHDAGPFAFAITATAVTDSNLDGLAGGSVIIPLTLRVTPGRFTLHLNAGAVHERGTGGTDPYWGTAMEWRLWGPLSAVAEAFATPGTDPTLHAGLQASLLDGRLTASVSYLDELEADGANGWSAGAALRLFTF